MKCLACFSENEEPKRFKYTPTTIDKLSIFDERNILCCNNCGFGMIEEDVDEEVLKRYYTSDYSGKARKQVQMNTENTDARTSYSFDLRSVSQLTLIRQYLDVKSIIRVVEIGAGTGEFLFSLRQMNFGGHYVAFEPQEQSHKCLEQLGSDIVKDIFDLRGAEKYKDSVDLVVMSHALEHFNPGKISEIVEAVRVMLREGGIFFCEVPNANLVIYPKAGERVVPHLSFFSIDSLKCFIENVGMNLLFINACGNSQLKKNQSEKIHELDSKGHFIFDLDQENGILRNRHYHRFLEIERIKKMKRQKLLNITTRILGKNIVMSILNLLRRYRQNSHSLLFGSNIFSYGTDREFIRLIALKRLNES